MFETVVLHRCGWLAQWTLLQGGHLFEQTLTLCMLGAYAVDLSRLVDFVQHDAMIHVILPFVSEETDEGEEEEEVEEGYAELVDTSKLIYWCVLTVEFCF